MAPGLGGFVSPLILTSLASSIYPDIRLMNLRYQLFGYIALALGAFFFFGNRLRKKRGTAPARSIG
jgi:hypothetical protein